MGPTSIRLSELVNYLKISYLKFDREVGLSSGLTQKYCKGTNISADSFEKIFLRYPDLNAEWLLKGGKPMWLGKEDIIQNSETPNTIIEEGNIYLLDLRAAAGFGSLLVQPQESWQLPRFSLPTLPRHKTYYCLQVQGESMEPTIWANDFVVCHRLENPADLNSGYIHVIVMNDNDVLIKRVVAWRSDPEHYILRSDNISFRESRILRRDVFQLFRVDLKISNNLPDNKERIQEQIDIIQMQVQTLMEAVKPKKKS